MKGERRLIDANELYLGKFLDARTDYHIGWNDALDAAASQANTVDAVEVVHGQWIEILSGQNSSGYECSICKRIVSVVSDVDLRERVLAKKYPYCHCGAKMDGGADNGI